MAINSKVPCGGREPGCDGYMYFSPLESLPISDTYRCHACNRSISYDVGDQEVEDYGY